MSSRVEELLAAAIDGSGTDGLDPPQSRNEKLLFALNNKLNNVESVLADGQAYQQLVTDGDGNAKWADRLAYETDPVLTEIVPEETVTFTPDSGMMTALWPPIFNAVEGQTYIVKFDGTEYKCSCTRLGREGGPLVLGNLSIPGVGDDTGEPFVMVYSGQWAFFSTDSATEHTISISDKQVSLSKIDEKYLPESA